MSWSEARHRFSDPSFAFAAIGVAVPDPMPSAAAAGRARRTVLETPSTVRPRRPRLLLLGLPMFAVFAAFGAIVWLAYEHGSGGPSSAGEPPLVKAPATAIKLAADESQEELTEGGEVLDLLSDAAEPVGQNYPTVAYCSWMRRASSPSITADSRIRNAARTGQSL